MFIKGMNRLRAAYLDIDPTLEPYFITGLTDDEAGIGQTYTMGATRRNLSHVAASAGIFIVAVNTIVAAGVTTFALWSLGPWAAAAGGIVGVAHFAFWLRLGWRSWQVNLTRRVGEVPDAAPEPAGSAEDEPGVERVLVEHLGRRAS